MTLFGGSYRQRKVLVTGHTGFKGSWLCLWLQQLGAGVAGIALDPETAPNHWDLLGLDIEDHRQDIRDAAALTERMRVIQPEIVFHLAAQPLVRRSYRAPLDTWSSNVLGTANLLEACRQVASVRAIVVVTSDKCYDNQEWPWGYRENDRLGGHDPYSASKAAAELVAASYRKSFMSAPDSPLLATARAGNVIGGGDWSEDRLVPDVVRAVTGRRSLEIRSPKATRPWQHVLESLSGYLALGQQLLAGRREVAEAWNFGPAVEGNRRVEEVLASLSQHWPGFEWHTTAQPQLHEAELLYLDSAKARQRLHWQPVWSWQQGLAETVAWYRAYLEQGVVISRRQLEAYVEAAQHAGIAWSRA